MAEMSASPPGDEGHHASIAPEWDLVDRALTRVGSAGRLRSAAPANATSGGGRTLSRGEVQRIAALEHAKTGAQLEKVPELSLDRQNLNVLLHPDDRGSKQRVPLAACVRLRKLTLRYNDFGTSAAALSVLHGALDALPELRDLALDGCNMATVPPYSRLA